MCLVDDLNYVTPTWVAMASLKRVKTDFYSKCGIPFFCGIKYAVY